MYVCMYVCMYVYIYLQSLAVIAQNTSIRMAIP